MNMAIYDIAGEVAESASILKIDVNAEGLVDINEQVNASGDRNSLKCFWVICSKNLIDLKFQEIN